MFVPCGSSPLTPEFDSLVQELLNKWKVPGMTIAVVHKHNVYSKVNPGHLKRITHTNPHVSGIWAGGISR